MEKTKPKKTEDLTQEEFDGLMKDLEKFEDKFFIALSGTDRFEIVPTSDGDHSLNKEQYMLIRSECSRLGLKIIYKIQGSDKITYVNAENGKIGYTHDGVH